MSYNTIKYETQDNILTLTLNRPEQMNAFTLEMASELIDAFHRASDDDGVRVIVVTGAGRAFCAGMDLSADGNVFGLDENLAPSMDDMRDRLHDPIIEAGVRDTGGQLTLAIFDCKKPVIAAINGAAVGIGATMTCAMDIRLASDKARIGFVFNKIGITPEACSTWFLPRIVGMGTALEWNLTGDIRNTGCVIRGPVAGSLPTGPQDQRVQPGGAGADAADDVSEFCRSPSARSTQGGFVGDLLLQPAGGDRRRGGLS